MERKVEIAPKTSSHFDPITVSAFIPSTSVIPGQHIPITISVVKGDTQKVSSIDIKLVRLEQNSSKQTNLRRTKSKDFISPGNVMYEMDLSVPKKINKKSKGNDERRYEVWVSVKIGTLKSCRLCLPVRIEPIGQTRGKIVEADNDVLIPIFAFK